MDSSERTVPVVAYSWPGMETAVVVSGCWPAMQTAMVVGGGRPAMDTAMELMVFSKQRRQFWWLVVAGHQ